MIMPISPRFKYTGADRTIGKLTGTALAKKEGNIHEF
jgi:hypothetical protein